ncbi:MAG TPA: beta-1,6-N-acetylglucosaminyltransferase [Gemmataceae bacterium]|nr:beta-1,6-N-acetylglucosaminyltransferase [Gemmataceae bacterium]
MNPLGFVLLTHNQPQQMLRLVRRLNAIYGEPPIVIHHDFGKCDLDTASFPGDVRFVRPHVPTEWGRFSLVEATLAGIRLLHKQSDAPEWFTLLSGADYPCAPASAVLADLERANADAFLQHHPVEPADPFCRKEPARLNRYLHYPFNVYYINPRLRFSWRPVRLPRWLSRPLLPFSRTFRCWAGWQWFTVNRKTVAAILDFHDNRPALARHYRKVWCADESYFHCILCNDPTLRIVNDNKRYTEWSLGDPHPKALGLADVPAILASGCWFARKFEPDSEALDGLDASLRAGSVSDGCGPSLTLPAHGA